VPTFAEHSEKAKQNYKFLNSFIFKTAHDWSMTVMFYTIVHLSEALIFHAVNKLKKTGSRGHYEIHCRTHDQRERQIKELLPTFHEPLDYLRKTSHDGRYKIYKFRPGEVLVAYNNYYKPFVSNFNGYCLNNQIIDKIELVNHTITL